jgi:hypothetical protein
MCNHKVWNVPETWVSLRKSTQNGQDQHEMYSSVTDISNNEFQNTNSFSPFSVLSFQDTEQKNMSTMHYI